MNGVEKMKKLLSFLLTGVLMITALSGFGVSAKAFTPSATTFKPVFDFDSTPDVYTNGYNPGTRTDTVGDSKSAKCITADGIGLTYNLTIDNSDSFSGNALRLDVTDLAPEGGSYCPVSFNVKYGANKLVDVSGATDFVFWIDSTKYTDGSTNQKGIFLYLQETNVAADGSLLTEEATAWKPKAGSAGGYYEYEQDGAWVKVENRDTDFILPANYRGWIKMPLSTFTYCDWTGENRNAKFVGKQIQVVQFGMGNYSYQAGATIVFDEMGFMGSFSKTTASATTTSTNNTSSKSTAVTTSAASATTPSSSEEISSENAESDANIDLATISSNTDETDNTKSDGNVILWTLIAVVIVLVAGGLFFYFFYVKTKNPDFFKNLFKKKG